MRGRRVGAGDRLCAGASIGSDLGLAVPGKEVAMRRLRQDLDWLTSTGLMLAAGSAIVTGIVSDIWDVRTFVPHIASGYVMTFLALVHVVLNWSRLVNYARFRWRLLRGRTPDPGPERPVRGRVPEPASPATILGRMLSRRGFVGLAFGGIGGLVIGRTLRTAPAIAAGDDLGLTYHQWSGPGLGDLFGTVADWGAQPPLYKTYPDSTVVSLPPAAVARPATFGELTARRRSIRKYAGRPLSLPELSAVVEQAAGITESPAGGRLRAAPSCGALYPIETYVAVHDVDGLRPGLYHHAVERRSLELIRAGDLRGELVSGGLYQEFLGEANAVVVLAGLFQRARWKYHERTYRYTLIEAGHYGQNVYLAATALGLGAAAVGAFFDGEVNRTLGLDGRDEAALYMVAVGAV